MSQPRYPLQPFQAPGEGYLPPKRPIVPLGRTLAWTAVVSTLGVALVVIVVGIDPAELWDGGNLRDVTDGSAGSVVLVILLAAVTSFALSAGVLLLLRRSDSVRRWASFLQAITSCGIVYLSGGLLLGVAFVLGG